MKTSEGRDYKAIEKKIIPVQDIDDYVSAVFYGRSGSGKTTLACDFPGPTLLLDIKDKGTGSVKDKKNLKVIEIEEWVELEQSFWYLRKNPGKFKTVILDTVSNMQQLAMQQILDDKGGSTNGGMLTKQDWGKVSGLMNTWIINFRDLSKINRVFLAQDRIFGGEEGEDNDGQITPVVAPRLSPSVVSTLCAAVDIIGNTFIREYRVKVKKDNKTISKRKVEYGLRVGPHAYYTTKIRKPKDVEIPDYIVDPTFKKLVDY